MGQITVDKNVDDTETPNETTNPDGIQELVK